MTSHIISTESNTDYVFVNRLEMLNGVSRPDLTAQ